MRASLGVGVGVQAGVLVVAAAIVTMRFFRICTAAIHPDAILYSFMLAHALPSARMQRTMQHHAAPCAYPKIHQVQTTICITIFATWLFRTSYSKCRKAPNTYVMYTLPSKQLLTPGLAWLAAGVAALASRDKGKAQSMADNLASLLPPDVAVLGSYNELIAYPDLDAVYIPLPSALHVEWVAKAAAKGLHILLEKPIAINADDMAAIFRATEQANVQLMDGTMWCGCPVPCMRCIAAWLSR
eukprot:184324-Chlamydomonas_euryale.AAC.2